MPRGKNSVNKNFKYLLLKKDDITFYKFYKNLKIISEDLNITESALISYFRHKRKLTNNELNNDNDIKRKTTFKLKDYKLIKLNEPLKLVNDDDFDEELIYILNQRKKENLFNYYNNINNNYYIMIS